MGLHIEWLKKGERTAYFARPERAGALPGVIVIQEAWGVDAHIQDVTRRFAKAGYAALAPDLFARDGVRPEAQSAERTGELQKFFNTLPPATMANPKARDEAINAQPNGARLAETTASIFGAAMNLPQFVPALVEWAKVLRAKNAQIFSVGFCMGGGLSALLAATDPQLSGAAIFYGMSPAADLVPRIRCPILGFYGGLDARITGTVAGFAEEMKKAGKEFTPRVYPGVMHAFFNDNRPSYDAAAARDAYARTLSFLAGS